MRQILLAFALLLGVSSVDAAFTTGNQLLAEIRDCDKVDAGQKTGDNIWGCGFRLGYAQAVFDAYVTLEDWKDFQPSMCLPSGVTGGQIVAIVRKYLEDNPADLHLNASSLVLNAYQEAFPCPSN